MSMAEKPVDQTNSRFKKDFTFPNYENSTLDNSLVPGSSRPNGIKIDMSLDRAADISLNSFKAINDFISKFANKVNQSLSDATRNLKSVFSSKDLFSMFKDDRSMSGDIKLPWHRALDEDTKQQILLLSADPKNFLRNPPGGVFHFDFDENVPVAKILLEQDPRLKKLRFELVPKRLKEETFWRNYFYRISLVQKLCRRHQKADSGNSMGLDVGNGRIKEAEDSKANKLQCEVHKEVKKKDAILQVDEDNSLKTNLEEEILELGLSFDSDIDDETGGTEWEKDMEQMLVELNDELM